MSGAALHVLLSGRMGADEREEWLRTLRSAAPEMFWWSDDDSDAPRDEIVAAVVANPAPGALAGMPNLRLVQSVWAGVENLLAGAALPLHVPLARMVDPAMNLAMAETALWAVLSLQRRFFDYAAQQLGGEWRQLPQRRADELQVLVLGLGQMGRAVASRLAAQGYRVAGWRASQGARDAPAGIAVASGGQALPALLATAEIVVNLLPLTPLTRGLIDARFLATLPRGASVVNLARGAHVVAAQLAQCVAGEVVRDFLAPVEVHVGVVHGLGAVGEHPRGFGDDLVAELLALQELARLLDQERPRCDCTHGKPCLFDDISRKLQCNGHAEDREVERAAAAQLPVSAFPAAGDAHLGEDLVRPS